MTPFFATVYTQRYDPIGIEFITAIQVCCGIVLLTKLIRPQNGQFRRAIESSVAIGLLAAYTFRTLSVTARAKGCDEIAATYVVLAFGIGSALALVRHNLGRQRMLGVFLLVPGGMIFAAELKWLIRLFSGW